MTPPAAAPKRAGDGYLGSFGLRKWWQAAFTPSERDFLESYLAPLLSENASWYVGTPPVSMRSSGRERDAGDFLTMLAGHLKRSDRAPLAAKLTDKARELASNPVAEHFALMTYVETRYKQRDTDPDAIPDVIKACRRAIAIAPDVIGGFKEQHRLEEEQAADLYAKMGKRYKREPFLGVPGSSFFKRLAIILRKQGLKEQAAEVEALHDRIWLPHTIDYKRAKADERKAARAAKRA